MNGPAIPWVVIAPCERQANNNHHQTLERLAERGGLSACEAVAVLESRKWYQMSDSEALDRLAEIVKTRYYLVELDAARKALELAKDTLTLVSEAAKTRDEHGHAWEHRCSDKVGGCTAVSESKRLESLAAIETALGTKEQKG